MIKPKNLLGFTVLLTLLDPYPVLTAPLAGVGDPTGEAAVRGAAHVPLCVRRLLQQPVAGPALRHVRPL